MKKCFRILLPLSLSVSSAAQDGGQDSYVVASRTDHETLWQRVEWETNQLGQAAARTNEFVEIATSLNYFDDATQRWEPSREEWEIFPDAIVARFG
jgi:hypothetical protein